MLTNKLKKEFWKEFSYARHKEAIWKWLKKRETERIRRNNYDKKVKRNTKKD
jgi:hypothetical protein